MRIFCDFDGTISRIDTADLVFTRFAGPVWEEIEARWVAGEIDAATCMTQQVELIDAPLSAINALLDEVELRDGFAAFLNWARARDIPFSIVSDGVDHFIRRILERHGIHGVTVIANRLVAAGENRWTLELPWRRADCAVGAGTCKCDVVGTAGNDRPTIYIGDGRSDFCVATRPGHIVRDRPPRETFCGERAIPFLHFNSFADVQAELEELS